MYFTVYNYTQICVCVWPICNTFYLFVCYLCISTFFKLQSLNLVFRCSWPIAGGRVLCEDTKATKIDPPTLKMAFIYCFITLCNSMPITNPLVVFVLKYSLPDIFLTVSPGSSGPGTSTLVRSCPWCPPHYRS